jgi:peptidoglycan-associated lipoprotein
VSSKNIQRDEREWLNMKTSCRTMMVGLIGLWLGGCSVVVFEDSAACPAQKTCPIDAIKVAPVPEGTELNALEQDDTAQNSTSADETASSASRQNGITGQTALISPVDEADQIDGHLSYFDVDSAALRTPTISGLLFVAEYLKANPNQRILVEGHCDERGTRDYNLALGEKRAEAIRRHLVRQGIDQRRIKTKSFGKERPAMLGASPEAWAKNRRTVIRLISD